VCGSRSCVAIIQEITLWHVSAWASSLLSLHRSANRMVRRADSCFARADAGQALGANALLLVTTIALACVVAMQQFGTAIKNPYNRP
jgi:hypothetical protein